ncbi:hypothetical protein AVEN_2578-1 [Araneus ventricosus]|uniref:Uncharacterized protein n=1 Tax=Araneus ventricosus TaxID=182803 RepID=A0A4Y2GUW4_ARAVE|nr:hypothetical protein AVEN_2578-1 [Araneus ventricosus]
MTDIGRRESVLIPRLPITPKDLSSQFKSLSHRIVCTTTFDEQLAKIFKFELYACSPSHFDESGMMREGSKSLIVTDLVPEANVPSGILDPGDVSYVIDGGLLPHRLARQRPATFKQI